MNTCNSVYDCNLNTCLSHKKYIINDIDCNLAFLPYYSLVILEQMRHRYMKDMSYARFIFNQMMWILGYGLNNIR